MSEDQGFRPKKRPETAGKEKKRYEKPAFRYERVFETLALACRKTVAPACDGVVRHKS